MNTPKTTKTASAQPENVCTCDHISFLNYALIEAREERDKAQAERDELLVASKPIIEANDAPGDDPNYAGFLTIQQANALRAAIAQVEGKQ